MNTNAIRELITQLQKNTSVGNAQKEIADLLFLLDIAEKYQIDKQTIKDVVSLPDARTGYSEFRIMNDCESDVPENWIEVRINEKPLRLAAGDIIIRKK